MLEACRAAAGSRVIITHGTDTMIESAQYLKGAIMRLRESQAAALPPKPAASSGSGATAGLVTSNGKDVSGKATTAPAAPPGAPAVAATPTGAAPKQAGRKPELARLLDMTIVLTGAMRPERFVDSDAPVNIGAAIAAVGILSPGVYVCMHGQLYEAESVERAEGTGTFVQRAAPEVGDGGADDDDEAAT